jgi:hypothetical protein
MAVDLESLDVNISMDISGDATVSTFEATDDSFSVGLTTDQDDIFSGTNQLNIEVDMAVSDGNIVMSHEDINNMLNMDLNGNILNVQDGTYDYNALYNKPKISGTTLIHDVPLVDIGVDILTNSELESLLV